jgi:acetyl esterase/lipase
MFQFGDLRLPPGRGPHPAIIFIHGGFWRNRYGLDYTGHLCASLANDGVASWSIEYSRVGDPEGGWPGTAYDALAGAAMLNSLSDYSIDLKRVAIAGHSAGGHLALWVAAQWHEQIELKRVISLGGVADLERAYELGIGDGAVEQFLGGRPDTTSDTWQMACPMRMLPMRTPQLLIHGTADEIVPLELAERFAERSTNAELLRLDGGDHFDVVDPRSRYWPMVLERMASAVR